MTDAGSSSLWGPLFGLRADVWAETWESQRGYGIPAYEYVLDQAEPLAGTKILDCGCGAGRFAQMATDREAAVSGIDASRAMIEVASQRVPTGDFRVGDLESLPWNDKSFDLVTGFNAFQFADNKVKALSEAGRVSRGRVVVVVPPPASESALAAAFQPMFPLFPEDGLAQLKNSGIFALSEPERLDSVVHDAGLTIAESTGVECPAVFEDVAEAIRAFAGAGPTMLAIRHSGEEPVVEAVRQGIDPFIDTSGRVSLPGKYRVVHATT